MSGSKRTPNLASSSNLKNHQGLVSNFPSSPSPSSSPSLPSIPHLSTSAKVKSYNLPLTEITPTFIPSTEPHDHQNQAQTLPQSLAALPRPPTAHIPLRTSMALVHVTSNSSATSARRPMERGLDVTGMAAATKCNIVFQVISLVLMCVGIWYAAQSLAASKNGQ